MRTGMMHRGEALQFSGLRIKLYQPNDSEPQAFFELTNGTGVSIQKNAEPLLKLKMSPAWIKRSIRLFNRLDAQLANSPLQRSITDLCDRLAGAVNASSLGRTRKPYIRQAVLDAVKESTSFEQEFFIGSRVSKTLQPALIRLLEELPIEQPLKDTLINKAGQAVSLVEKNRTRGRFKSYRLHC